MKRFPEAGQVAYNWREHTHTLSGRIAQRSLQAHTEPDIRKGVIYALLAAVLFGVSTPLAKPLANTLPPALLAGLLYLGSGLGLSAVWGWRYIKQYGNSNIDHGYLKRTDLPWFAGAVLSGGAIGPLLLMFGLQITPSATASLLLNLEGVLTAGLAWFVFKENFDKRILLGMMLIVMASITLTFQPLTNIGHMWGLAAIAGACLCWAIDNNLTRKVSASDAVQIACLKGLFAGTLNISIAMVLGSQLPTFNQALPAMSVGFAGYGVSLVCFVLALRHLGTARTGAYFSMAPFVGALASLVFLGEDTGVYFWVAFALMATGIALHLTERHDHLHEHTTLCHTHAHVHDIHHQHTHDFDWDGSEPHTHQHVHEPLTHTHPHYPDIHHQHKH